MIDKVLYNNFESPIKIDDNIIKNTNIITNENGESFINSSLLSSETLSKINITSKIEGLTQVVQLNKNDFLSAGFSEKITSTLIDNSYYIVGTGGTGASATLLTIGSAYLVAIGASALMVKLPHKDLTKSNNNNNNNEIRSMTVEEAFKTPQFWLMWMALFCTSSTGMGCISTAKQTMSEVFSQALPNTVTASFASSYVMAISAANLSGRLGWAALSDKIGRFSVFNFFGLAGCALYGLIPFYINNVVHEPSLAPLALFCGSTLMVFSFFGGIFSVTPGYEVDYFGNKNIAAIHGRMMTAVACSGFVGPMIVTHLREKQYIESIYDLSQHVDPRLFNDTFRMKLNNDNISILLENKVISIKKLMELIPNDMNIIDPTPFLYDNTMYTMSALMATTGICNILLRQIGKPHLNYRH